MVKKLIVFDIDGTLFDNENKIIPASTIASLKALKAQGHHLAIATGRARYMLHSISAIQDLFTSFILINGQHVISQEKDIYKNTVELPLLQKLVQSMAKNNLTYGFQSEDDEALNHLNIDAINSFKILSLNVPKEDPFFHLNNVIYQVWCFCTPIEIEKIKEENPDFTFMKWLQVGYDIIKKGESKGKGLCKLRSHLKIAKEDVIAFGDGDNDIDLLKESGLGIAMGNATIGLKAISDFITTKVNEDGITVALKHYHLL